MPGLDSRAVQRRRLRPPIAPRGVRAAGHPRPVPRHTMNGRDRPVHRDRPHHPLPDHREGHREIGAQTSGAQDAGGGAAAARGQAADPVAAGGPPGGAGGPAASPARRTADAPAGHGRRLSAAAGDRALTGASTATPGPGSPAGAAATPAGSPALSRPDRPRGTARRADTGSLAGCTPPRSPPRHGRRAARPSQGSACHARTSRDAPGSLAAAGARERSGHRGRIRDAAVQEAPSAPGRCGSAGNPAAGRPAQGAPGPPGGPPRSVSLRPFGHLVHRSRQMATRSAEVHILSPHAGTRRRALQPPDCLGL